MTSILMDMVKSKFLLVIAILILGFSYISTKDISIVKSNSLRQNDTHISVK